MSLTTVNLLSRLTDADHYPDRPNRFHAQGVWESRQTVVHYALTVDHDQQEWSARDLTNGIDSSFRDGTLTTGAEQSPSRSYRARVTNSLLQLLFPEHLPVWGRANRDTDTPIATEDLGDGRTLVLLKSLQDPALRKTLVIDNHTGLITRFYDSLTATALDGITQF